MTQKAKQENEKVEKVSHKNLYEALAAFQAELKPIERDGHVKFQTQKGEVDFWYATLGKIAEKVMPLLGKHGLSYRHKISEEGVECVLSHETATTEFVTLTDESSQTDETGMKESTTRQRVEVVEKNTIYSGVVPISAKSKTDMKDIGAGITYARRYTLSLVLGVAAEEDKDAEFIAEQAQNLETYAYRSVTKRIEEAKTAEEAQKHAKYCRSEIERIEANEKPAVSLPKEKFEELAQLAEQRAKQLEGENDVS